MPRYLIRSGKLPYDPIPTSEYLQRNILGSNSGNFLYLQGIIRTLMTDSSVSFVSTNYRLDFTDHEIDKINAECDGFIIPLADAFRLDFVNEMQLLAKLIKRLYMPCWLIGVGVSRGALDTVRKEAKIAEQKRLYKEGALAEPPEGKVILTKAVKGFINAVLEKNTVIGIRGADTAEFLSELGYTEGEHFRVIGCPSMYTYGTHLKIRDTEKGRDCPAAFNMSQSMKARKFITNARAQFDDCIYVGQVMGELQTLYWGTDFRNYHSDEPWDVNNMTFPSTIDHPLYKQDKVRFFVNAHEWVEFMKTRDFVFGTRLHGNIAAVIAGTPSLMIAKDKRMKELAEFHGLCYIMDNHLKNYKDIHELIADVDLHSPEKKQRENFENFLDFLRVNGFKTIYDDDIDRADAPFDELVAEVKNPIKSAVHCSTRELAERIVPTVDYFREERKSFIRQIRRRNIELGHLYKVLGCRPLRLTISARNAVLPEKKRIVIKNLFEREELLNSEKAEEALEKELEKQ